MTTVQEAALISSESEEEEEDEAEASRSCTVSEASSIIKQQQRNNLAGSLKAVRSLTVPQPWAYALDPGKKGSGFTDLHAQGFV